MYPVLSLLTPSWLRSLISNHLPAKFRRASAANKTGGKVGVRTSLIGVKSKHGDAASFKRLVDLPGETSGVANGGGSDGRRSGSGEHAAYVPGRNGSIDPTIRRNSELGLPSARLEPSRSPSHPHQTYHLHHQHMGRGTQGKAARVLGEDFDGSGGGRSGSGAGNGAMAMDDLRRLGLGGDEGEGIAVRTEITVTAEERIEALVGI